MIENFFQQNKPCITLKKNDFHHLFIFFYEA